MNDEFLCLRASYHLSHDLRHDRLSTVGGLLHLFVAYCHRHVKATKIRDDTHSEDLNATMMSYDYLGNCGHAHCIAT